MEKYKYFVNISNAVVGYWFVIGQKTVYFVVHFIYESVSTLMLFSDSLVILTASLCVN